LKIIPEHITLEEDIPSPANVPSGCVFHTRCYTDRDICQVELPLLVAVQSDHRIQCRLF
jgi:oligopeptide/dipeptide ABC transporter ATP-binding protein